MIVWDGVLKPFQLEEQTPVGAVVIEVLSKGRLELDELMILPAVTKAVYPVTDGGEIILRTASIDAEAETVPGESDSAYGADGKRLRPITRGRRALSAGSFAVPRR